MEIEAYYSIDKFFEGFRTQVARGRRALDQGLLPFGFLLYP